MYCATFRTQAGSVVGLSITTSNLRPLSALMSPFMSPISCSTRPLKKSGRVLLRLISVTSCPRAIAYSTCSGPVNPVPPRMRILSGFFARSTGARRETSLKRRVVREADFRKRAKSDGASGGGSRL